VVVAAAVVAAESHPAVVMALQWRTH